MVEIIVGLVVVIMLSFISAVITTVIDVWKRPWKYMGGGQPQ